MALPTWPADLPGTFKIGAVRAPKDLGHAVFRTEVGPGMVRRRSAVVEEVYSVIFRLSETQYGSFEAFFYTTLGAGVRSFTMANPITGTTDRFRFDPEAKPPFAPAFVAAQWHVTCHLLRRR